MDNKKDERSDGMIIGQEIMTGLDILTKPFSEEYIKKRKILRNGNVKEVDYIPGCHIISRLNECYGTNWSFNIVDRIVDFSQKQVAVCGVLRVLGEPRAIKLESLTVESNPEIASHANIEAMTGELKQTQQSWVEKQQWGGVSMNTYESGRIVCLGDDLKIATTDALKKCATLLGVGLYLYDQDNDADIVAPTVSPEKTAETEKTEPISAVQIEAIKKIIKEHSIDEETLKKALGVESFETLTSSEAAKFIIRRHPFWEEQSKS